MGTTLPPNSRYHGVGVAEHVGADGVARPYLRRRLVPPPERFALLTEHVVTDGDRLDRITAAYLVDPELFWKLCDANRATRPDELTEVAGRRLRIPLPEGIPGLSHG